MTSRVLVTGGTGTLGRAAVAHLLAAGADVRVLSRGRRPVDGTLGVHRVVGDVATGAGLALALRGVDTVVHCTDPVTPLIDAARRAAVGHVVAISIVGVDRVPLPYYGRKLADEQRLARSGLGWTVLRATQFHDLVEIALRTLGGPPVLVLPRGWRFQPVDVGEVGARMASLAAGPPAGRVPDLGGPEVRTMDDLARAFLAVSGRHRPIVSVPVPGRVAGAYLAGGHLAPEHADGTVTFEDHLAARAGARPYPGVLRSRLPRPTRRQP